MDQRKWRSDEFAQVRSYEGLKALDEIVQRGLQAEAGGEWRNLQLNSYDEYGATYMGISGERPETDTEMAWRLEQEAIGNRSREEAERLLYENLKKKFG